MQAKRIVWAEYLKCREEKSPLSQNFVSRKIILERQRSNKDFLRQINIEGMCYSRHVSQEMLKEFP